MRHKYSIIVLALLFVYSSAFSQTTISGRILGGDGKPLPAAHIHYLDNGVEVSKPANADGSFTINASGDEFKFNISGAFHENKSYIVPIEKDKNLTFDIYLKPIKLSSNEYMLIGSFNNFSMDEGAIPFVKRKDGKLAAKFPVKKDTLVYQVLMTFGDTKRSFNGTQTSFYIYDGGGDYRSALIPKKGNLEIVFEPSVFNNLSLPTKELYTDDPAIMESLELPAKAEAICNTMRASYWMDYEKNEGKNAKDIKAAYLDTMIKEVVTKAANPKLKDEMTMKMVELLYLGMTNNEIKNDEASDLIRALIKKTPATSPFWSKHKYNLVHAIELTADPDKSLYLKNVIDQHPDTAVGQQGIYGIIRHADLGKDDKVLNKYFTMFVEKYPNSNLTRTLKREYTEPVVQVGKWLPDFKLTNLDNPGEVISPEKLKGKFVMIDFWGTWCGPCLSEMPYLDSAYKKFKERNFTILSLAIDKAPENITKFREGKWSMPWMHAFIPKGWDDEICDIFKITGVPTCLLIDPEGKIVAVDSDLRRERLYKTLDNTLPPPPPTIYDQVH